MVALLTDPNAWLALATLTALEIVLGIDNIVFIAILTARLPKEQQGLAYRLGLGGAMFTRIGLLLAISWVMSLTNPWFVIVGTEISGRDFILLVGGLFLIAKSSTEIYEKVEGDEHEDDLDRGKKTKRLVPVVIQIMLLDIVFSLDSVITAVGMVNEVAVMIAAVVLAIIVMLVFAKKVGDFVNRNPAIKILALSFLMLIGVLLTAEAFDRHIEKGYIYFAMSFSLLVELMNMRFRRRHRKKKNGGVQVPEPAQVG